MEEGTAALRPGGLGERAGEVEAGSEASSGRPQPLLVERAEARERGEHGVGGGLAQAAAAGDFNAFAELLQYIKVLRLTFACENLIKIFFIKI